MPNNKNERKGKQAGELSAEERFRNFFSTSVIDLPEEMTHRDEPAPVEEKPKAGLLGKLFGHDKAVLFITALLLKSGNYPAVW